MLKLTKIITWAEKELANHGNVCARKEAELLLCHLLRCERIILYIDNKEIAEDIFILFEKFIKKRCSGYPLQYLTHETYFFGLRFIVDEGVFIPRPETEVLVERVIKLLNKNFKYSADVLELCTGCGNISVALTKNVTYCKILCSDINPQALAKARGNAHNHGTDKRIEFLEIDLLAGFKQSRFGRHKFDLIIANPPYINSDQISNLPKEISYEPRNALDGGSDGLNFYRRIITESPRYLRDNGFIAFEFGDNQQEQIKEIITQSKKFQNLDFFSDLNGICRFVIAGKK